MKLLAALFTLAMSATLVSAQGAKASEYHPIKISSLNTPFAVQVDFEGEYRLLGNTIEFKLKKTDISVSEHCPYKGRRLLTGIRINLATATQKSWKIDVEGLASPLRHEMSAGDKWSLGESHFFLPIRSDMDLSGHWFVVQIEESSLDYPENDQPKGYSFAHSARDIFTAN